MTRLVTFTKTLFLGLTFYVAMVAFNTWVSFLNDLHPLP